MLEHRPGGKSFTVRSASQSYGYSFKAELQFNSHARRIVRASPSQAISSRQGLALLATTAPNASPHAWPLDRPFDVGANTERIPSNVAFPACSRSAAFRVFPLSAAVSAGHVRVPLRDTCVVCQS